MNQFFGFSGNNRQKKGIEPLRRRLGVESLESRELLNASIADLPQPEYAPPIIATAATTTVTQTKLLAPKSVSKGIDVTPTTLNVRWAHPSSTIGITGYEVTLIHTQTKAIVKTVTVNLGNDLSCKFEGLSDKTKYQISIKSLGDPDTTDNSKATLNLSATTATFPVVTAKAQKPGLTSTEIIITDKDKIIPFENGKTVKTYTVQYAAKATSINWSAAPSVVVPAGTVADAAKGTISCVINGLQPGENYVFRVTATYTEGTGSAARTLTSTSKDVSFKTTALPAPTLAKAEFTIINGELCLFPTVKQTNPTLFQTGTVSYTLYFSTTTAKIGLPPDAQKIGTDKIGTAATFTMQPFTLKEIAALLGESSPGKPALLGLTSFNLQLVATYTDGGVTAEVYSKVLKVSLPKWYVPT